MALILILLLGLAPPVYAKSARTVTLADGEIAPIYVEAGFSTVLKFDSRPERGLIGDQDGFKVEYLKNVVAIKPLLLSGRTNLFLFTKEGQFNFQLIAARGRHDNVVYVRPKLEKPPPSQPTENHRISIPLEAMRTRKISKSVSHASTKLTVESVATPPSGSVLIIRFTLSRASPVKKSINPKAFSVAQKGREVRVENIYLETKEASRDAVESSGLLMIRAERIEPRQPIELRYLVNATEKQVVSVAFAP